MRSRSSKPAAADNSPADGPLVAAFGATEVISASLFTGSPSSSPVSSLPFGAAVDQASLSRRRGSCAARLLAWPRPVPHSPGPVQSSRLRRGSVCARRQARRKPPNARVRRASRRQLASWRRIVTRRSISRVIRSDFSTSVVASTSPFLASMSLMRRAPALWRARRSYPLARHRARPGEATSISSTPCEFWLGFVTTLNSPNFLALDRFLVTKGLRGGQLRNGRSAFVNHAGSRWRYEHGDGPHRLSRAAPATLFTFSNASSKAHPAVTSKLAQRVQ